MIEGIEATPMLPLVSSRRTGAIVRCTAVQGPNIVAGGRLTSRDMLMKWDCRLVIAGCEGDIGGPLSSSKCRGSRSPALSARRVVWTVPLTQQWYCANYHSKANKLVDCELICTVAVGINRVMVLWAARVGCVFRGCWECTTSEMVRWECGSALACVRDRFHLDVLEVDANWEGT